MPKWSPAPVESCQSVVQKSLWGRLGSVNRRAQSPTPHTPPLPASDTFVKMHLQLNASDRSSPTIVAPKLAGSLAGRNQPSWSSEQWCHCERTFARGSRKRVITRAWAGAALRHRSWDRPASSVPGRRWRGRSFRKDSLPVLAMPRKKTGAPRRDPPHASKCLRPPAPHAHVAARFFGRGARQQPRVPSPAQRQQGASLQVAGASRVDAFRAAAPRAPTARSASVPILDSVAERPRGHDDGEDSE